MIHAGLVLEGGAERGIFTAGVLDYLMEKELWLEYTCGVSAGACAGVDYVSRQIGRTRDALIPRDRSYRMAKPSCLLTQRSLIDMDMLFDRFPNDLIPFDYDTYFASDLLCEMVVTDCATGRAEYMDDRKDRDRFMTICRASSSIPVFAPPVGIDGRLYVDGEVSDAIPVLHSMKKGYRKNIVVLTRQKGYRKKAPGSLMKALYRARFGRYEELLRRLLYKYTEYNRTLDMVEKWEAEGKLFVFRPTVTPVDRLEMNPDRLKPFYAHGYEQAEERFSEMEEYLGLNM